MRILTLLAFLSLASSFSSSQTSTGALEGRVFIENEGAGTGATVILEGTELGAFADIDGRFRVAGVPVGRYHVVVRFVGYEQPDSVQVTIAQGRTAYVELTLRQSVIPLPQVEVTGSRLRQLDDTRSSVTRISPRAAKYLPGAAEDVLRSLQALPGVTSVSDYSAQLVIRGSGPDQNLIMMDGFEVLNPYRLYGVVSMFNPETVNEISLQTGGFQAQYGDRLSAVLDVRNRDGRSDIGYGGKINTSLTNANLILEGGLPAGGAFLVSARRTYYDLILEPFVKSAKLVDGDVALPNFRDLQVKATMPLSAQHRITLNALTSRDGVELVSGTDRPRPDSVSIADRSYNWLIGGTWQANPLPNVVLLTQLSWYRNSGVGAFDASFVDPSQNSGELGRLDTLGLRFYSFSVDYDYRYSKTSFTQRLLVNSEAHSIEAGYGIDVLNTERVRFFEIDPELRDYIDQRGFIIPNNITTSINYNRFHLFLQDRISLSSRLFVQPGIRLDVYPFLSSKYYVVPRLNVSYGLDDLTSLRAAYGMFYQSPGMEKQNFNAPLNFTQQSFANLVAERADHYIIGLDRMLSPTWQFKTEAYYKKFRGVVVPEKLHGSRWFSGRIGSQPFDSLSWATPVRIPTDSLTSTPVNDATGESYGFEVMVQKVQSTVEDRFGGWISYALSFSERDRDGVKSPFIFDQRHAVNVVGEYRFSSNWELGAKFTLRSGRPYSKGLGVKPRVGIREVNGVGTPVIQTDSDGKVILDVEYEQDRFSGRLNLYHTLNVRLTTYPSWWGLRWSVYLDVSNIYNRKNQQQIGYFVDEQGALRERVFYGIPIFPSLGMSLTF